MHHNSAVKNNTEKMKIKIGNSANNKDGTEPVKKTIEKYMNQPSILLIETALRNSEKCKI